MSARKNKMSADSPTPNSGETVSSSPTPGVVTTPTQTAKKTYAGRGRRSGKADETSKTSPQKDTETDDGMDEDTNDESRESRTQTPVTVEAPAVEIPEETQSSSSPTTNKSAITESEAIPLPAEISSTVDANTDATISELEADAAPEPVPSNDVEKAPTPEPPCITSTPESSVVATPSPGKKKGRPKLVHKPNAPLKRQIGTRNLGLKNSLLPRRSLQDVKAGVKAKASGKVTKRRATIYRLPDTTDKKEIKVDPDTKKGAKSKGEDDKKENIKLEVVDKIEIKKEIETPPKGNKETDPKLTPTTSVVKRKGRPPKSETIKRKIEEEKAAGVDTNKKVKLENVSADIETLQPGMVVPGLLSTSIDEILKDVKSRLADHDAPESKCSETDTESISEKLSETCESLASQDETKSILDDSIQIKKEPSDITDTETDGTTTTEKSSKQKNLDKKPVRRSGRPRKSTLKDRDLTPTRKLTAKLDIKVESGGGDDTSRDSAMTSTADDVSQTTEDVTPLHIDTTTKSPTPLAESSEKDVSSLSPLESEGVSEISVKQFYGEPAFLENNRGIEKDPKLGEIVQVQEKINSVSNVNENAVMDTESAQAVAEENVIKEDRSTEMDKLLIDEKEDLDFLKEDESLGEELKMDESIDEELEEKLLNSDEDTQLKDVKIDDKLEEELLEEAKIEKDEDEDNNNLVIDEDQTTNCSEETAIVTEESTATELMITESDETIKTSIKEEVVEPEKQDKPQKVVEETKETEDKMEIVEEKITQEKAKQEPEEIKNDDKLSTDEKENIDENKKNVILAVTSSATTKAISESPESLKLKETHLKSLGLLTIKEADEKKEKQRQKEKLQSSSASSTSSTGSGSSKTKSRNGGNNNSNGNNSNNNNNKDKSKEEEYTGTLKTVIKVPRPNNPNEKRKRLPLKMTFQKGRGKNGNEKDPNTTNQTGDDVYYTIQNEGDGNETTTASTHGGHNSSRKTHNRTHTDGGSVPSEPKCETGTPGQEVKKALVIPEKASSFSIHPGRICRDQCFYCGGKFGLFDTPCHVAQIKSAERQKKILDNEEKLAVDSCLCDACYRHVDRRANCPSYKKRLSQPGTSSASHNNSNEQSRDNSSEEGSHQHHHQVQQQQQKEHQQQVASHSQQILCSVTNCSHIATQHSLRRKWLLKMRKSIEKLININLDTNSSPIMPICDNHYDVISHLMVCSLCRKKLPKNHIFYINQEINILERKLSQLGIPVVLGSMPVVCKICRYFANLLLKPPDPKTQKDQFIKSYRSRLLQFRSIEYMETSDSDGGPYINNNNNQVTIKLQPAKGKSKVQQHSVSKTQRTPQKEQILLQDSYDGNGGHILLDNDVMVNYDVPMIEMNTPSSQPKRQQNIMVSKNPSKHSRYSNESATIESNNDMARILRANPNISMRELLPGEEDLGMCASIPFNNGKKTPEGWSKVQTIIQYDDVTKQMFEELQKPYGNQSSFLRHLVLLEKYFRNGDLVLSQNASFNAMSYSESVQTRLKSYDNVATGGLPIMHQLSAPIQITPTVTIKPKPKLNEFNQNSSGGLNQISVATTSLLKNNIHNNPSTSSSHHHSSSNLNKGNRQISVTTESNQHEILAAASKYIKLDETTIMPTPKKGSGAIPPELISITKTSQPAIAITPISNRKSPAPNVSSPPASISTATTPPVPTASTSASTSSAPSTSTNCAVVKPQQQQQFHHNQQQQQIIKLPDTLNGNERKQINGKPWRPTLIPITQGTLNIQQQGPLYQTADGRRLPGLVQVLSGGKPYHISIEDYNRMCILRREKLITQQMNKDMQQHQNNNSNHNNSSNSNNGHNTSGSSTNSSSSNNNGSGNTPPTNQQNSNKSLSVSDDGNRNSSASSNLSKKLQIPNKILEQNSLIPVGSSNKGSSSTNLNELSLRKRTKSGSTLVGGGISNNNNGAATSLLKSHVPIAPKPPQLPNSTTVLAVASSLPSSITATVMKTMTQTSPHTLTITTTNSPASSTIISTSTATVTLPPSIEMIKTTAGGNFSWIDHHSSSLNGCTITTPGSGGTLLIDNSAVSVLSKIPKSLTVIPQQKSSAAVRSRVSSIEDLTSA